MYSEAVWNEAWRTFFSLDCFSTRFINSISYTFLCVKRSGSYIDNLFFIDFFIDFVKNDQFTDFIIMFS